MEIVLENYKIKILNDILWKVNDSVLCHQTITCGIQDVSNNFKDQLAQNLKNCMYFSLALDESCSVSDIAQ